jgi:heptosyltransferase-3
LARLLGARWAVTHRVKGRGKFWRNSFTHHVPRAAAGRRHTVEAHLDVLRRIGIQPEQRRLLLVPGGEAEANIRTRMGTLGLTEGRFIHLHPASRWLFKGWTVDGWVALIEALLADGWPLMLTAAPDPREQELLAAITARLPAAAPVHNLAGQLSLLDLGALTARAALFIGVDSAPMHIAAAVGTPVVTLFGPSGDLEWGPWQVPSRTLTSADHPCRPCGLDGCGGSKLSDCLTSLPAARVIAAARELLGPQTS